MKYYEIIRYKRTHPFAVALVRWCCCTAGDEDGHEWTMACDRYPPEVIMTADGTLLEADALKATLHEIGTKRPGRVRTYQHAEEIGPARYRYLTDLERWATYHHPRHPIANTHRRIDPKRRRFLTNEYV